MFAELIFIKVQSGEDFLSLDILKQKTHNISQKKLSIANSTPLID